MITPVIRTPRLVLDELRLEDAVHVTEYCRDPVLQSFVPVPVPYSEADGEAYVTSYAAAVRETSGALWAIRIDGAFAGPIELTPESGGSASGGSASGGSAPSGSASGGSAPGGSASVGSASVGYWLGAPFRRRGIMSEALAAVVDFGFSPDGMALDRLYWEAVAGNVGSAGAARRVGFRFEGVAPGALVHRDIRLDRWSASLLATDPRTPADGWPR